MAMYDASSLRYRVNEQLDVFLENLDGLRCASELTDDEFIRLVRRELGEDIGEIYENWLIEGAE